MRISGPACGPSLHAAPSSCEGNDICRARRLFLEPPERARRVWELPKVSTPSSGAPSIVAQNVDATASLLATWKRFPGQGHVWRVRMSVFDFGTDREILRDRVVKDTHVTRTLSAMSTWPQGRIPQDVANTGESWQSRRCRCRVLELLTALDHPGFAHRLELTLWVMPVIATYGP